MFCIDGIDFNTHDRYSKLRLAALWEYWHYPEKVLFNDLVYAWPAGPIEYDLSILFWDNDLSSEVMFSGASHTKPLTEYTYYITYSFSLEIVA